MIRARLVAGATLGLCAAVAPSTLSNAQQTAPGAQRPAETAQATAQGLTLVAQSGEVSYGPTNSAFDFGDVDRTTTPKLEHTFLLRNSGAAPAIIDRVQPTCGCETTLLAVDGKTSDGSGPQQSATVPPGRDASVRLAVDLTHLAATRATKTVYVFANGSAEPACTLEVSFNLHAEVTFYPPMLDFGSVQAGTARSVPVKVTIAARVLKPGVAPQLTSNNPDIHIAPSPAVLSADGKTVTLSALVTIASTAPIGPINAAVSLAGPPAAPKPAAGALIAMSATPGIGMALTAGQVVGKIAASPGLVMFGVVDASREATRQITVTGESAALLDGLKVAAAVPVVTARLLPAPRSSIASEHVSAVPARVLEVTLRSGRPPGTLDTTVMLTAADGERLVVPVVALNAAAPPR